MFQGFTDETVDFMWGIRFNNEKAWFEDHKDQYLTQFYRPMRELSDELYDWFRETWPQYGAICRLTRIYRDARRLHGRGPYKDSLWFSVEKPVEQWTGTPVFWFELSPESWAYGLGYYMARPVTMARLRARMDKDPGPMEDFTRRLAGQSDFVLSGEEYRRPKSASASELLEPWYRKKSFSLIHEEPLSEVLFSRELVTRIQEGWRFLQPFYDYFVSLDGDPDPREV